MTYVPVTRYPLVHASAAESTTNGKILKFMCMYPFKCSPVHFEGVMPAARLRASVSVRYDALVSARNIMYEV